MLFWGIGFWGDFGVVGCVFGGIENLGYVGAAVTRVVGSLDAVPVGVDVAVISNLREDAVAFAFAFLGADQSHSRKIVEFLQSDGGIECGGGKCGDGCRWR